MPTRRVAKTIGEKKEVLGWIETQGDGVPTCAVRHFQNERGWKISGAQVRYWRKDRVAIKNAQFLQLRLKRAEAKPSLGEIEDLLFDQVLYLRANKEKVSRQWIQASARELGTTELKDSEFAASDKWLSSFMIRYGLSLHCTTNLTVLSDNELTDRAVRLMAYLEQQKPSFDLTQTVLMDESAVCFEDPRRDTIGITGARHVVLHSMRFASMRATAVLAVSASGRKLPRSWPGRAPSRRKRSRSMTKSSPRTKKVLGRQRAAAAMARTGVFCVDGLYVRQGRCVGLNASLHIRGCEGGMRSEKDRHGGGPGRPYTAPTGRRHRHFQVG